MSYDPFDGITWAYQLLPPGKVPAGFDRDVTRSGLLSHGRKRYPVEWDAILADEQATMDFSRWILSNRPDDGEQRRVAHAMLRAAADRGWR